MWWLRASAAPAALRSFTLTRARPVTSKRRPLPIVLPLRRAVTEHGPLPPVSLQVTPKRPLRTVKPPLGMVSCSVATGTGTGFGSVGSGAVHTVVPHGLGHWVAGCIGGGQQGVEVTPGAGQMIAAAV